MLSQKDLLSELKDHFEQVQIAEMDNRMLALEDLRFTFEPGAQWEQSVVQQRNMPNGKRPMYSYNRVLPIVNQLIGDQRQNRPSVKFRAADNKDDPEMSEIWGGMYRADFQRSDGDTAIDNAFMYAVSGGFGAFRLTTEYNSDDGFEQDVVFKPIWNPFTVYFDPGAMEITREDAQWAVVTTRLTKQAFEKQYPKAEISSLNDPQFGDRGWFNQAEVRIAEYYRKSRKRKQLALLSDGRTIELTKEVAQMAPELAQLGIQIVRTRFVDALQIEWYKCSGAEFLAEPITYDWKYIPIVPVYGRRVNIEGKERYAGVVREAKDPQRTYNYLRTTAVETAAMTPRAPYLVTPKMVEGYEAQWADSHAKLRPYLKYNVDPTAPGNKPFREPPPDIPAALLQLAQADAGDIHSTTGIFEANLGAPSNEKSGRAIMARQREGDVGSYFFIDNLSKALKYAGKVYLDIAQTVYDTQRVMRVIGDDNKEDLQEINLQVPDLSSPSGWKVLRDTTRGKYDIVVDIGPSYTTQRQEAADRLLQLTQRIPAIAQLAPDLIVDGLDIPNSEEIARRLRMPLIQQGVVEPNEDEQKAMQQRMAQMAPQMQQQQQEQALMKELAMRSAVATTHHTEAKAALDKARAVESVARAHQIGTNTHATAVGTLMDIAAGPPQQNEG
jgi:hypothetical protein